MSCDTILKGTVISMGPGTRVFGQTIVANGEHLTVDRRDAVRRTDELQETPFDEVDPRRFVRMGSRFSWIGA